MVAISQQLDAAEKYSVGSQEKCIDERENGEREGV
jgi:hypothetical protein